MGRLHGAFAFDIVLGSKFEVSATLSVNFRVLWNWVGFNRVRRGDNRQYFLLTELRFVNVV